MNLERSIFISNNRTKHRHETKNIKAESNRSLIRRLSRAVPF